MRLRRDAALGCEGFVADNGTNKGAAAFMNNAGVRIAEQLHPSLL